MKEKKLHISAIIPESLYIQRDADRKLEEAVIRMSKPAYISVARQMGKTNLLIHAKKKLENATNRYVFIDVTNKFEQAQDCFRYIVDQIIEANDSIKEFQIAANIIKEKRLPTTNNPTKEYQDELRTILKIYKGKLVVFLDEVDDLRKHNFSDDIFAQIRKTYFLRVTYPEFDRLSYVLCGVIDPEKLIKNKENSPFNIAIPIYLDDFTKEEFVEFTKKTEVFISEEITDYVYDWVKGNPRMTFDIMSKIEDESLNGKPITLKLVSEVIEDIYFKNFKHPPIDHIRDIVKHNTEVRKAVLKLKQGKVSELSDDIKNKLYLFGIIGSKFDKENISIKNKIIERCLSNEWLEQIELEKSGYFDLGKEKISSGLPEDGIKYLKEYIQNSPKGNLVGLANYYIGEAYHGLGKYQQSNQYLLEKPIDKERSLEFYFSQIFFIGINYFKLEEFEKAVSYFDEIISDAKDPQAILSSFVNKGELLLNLRASEPQNLEEFYLNTLSFLEGNKDKIDEKYQSIIYYRLGFVLHDLNKEKAHPYFVKALEFAKDEEKILILLYIDSCVQTNIEERKSIYLQIGDLIIDKKLKFTDKEKIIINFTEYHLLLCLVNLLEFEFENKFQELFDYSLANLFKNYKEYELMNKIAKHSISSSNLNVPISLFEKVLKYDDVEPNIKKQAYQYTALLIQNDDPKKLDYLNRYINLFSNNNNFNEDLTINDFNAFIYVIAHYRKLNNIEKSFKTAEILYKQFKPDLSIELKANTVLIRYFIMDYYIYLGDNTNALIHANINLNIISEVKPTINELSYIDKKGLSDIELRTKKYLENAERITKQIEPIRVTREKGRNEWVKVKYKNGSIVLEKYKKVKEDLERGDCILVE